LLPRYIQDIILNGEGLTVDFKHSIADSYKIAKSLVSFANSAGGMLLVGVDDKGRVVGVDEDEETYMLDVAALKYCKPQLEITYKKHTRNDGNTVLECNVQKGKQTPYACKEIDGKWRVYFRQDDECKLASVVRFRMMEMQASAKGDVVFNEQDKQVIELVENNPDGLTKKQIVKKLSIPYHQIISTIARLMYLNVLKEKYNLNKIIYLLR